MHAAGELIYKILHFISEQPTALTNRRRLGDRSTRKFFLSTGFLSAANRNKAPFVKNQDTISSLASPYSTSNVVLKCEAIPQPLIQAIVDLRAAIEDLEEKTSEKTRISVRAGNFYFILSLSTLSLSLLSLPLLSICNEQVH